MAKIENNRTLTLIILILSFVAVSVYVISLKVAYPLFQNTRLADPLASLHALFPLYYVAIILAMAACLVRFISGFNSRALDLWLLVLLALMLWYTPYALAGATYQLDGLRFIDVSKSVPELLKGEPLISKIANYGRHYPTSFIFHWIFIRVIGIGVPCYMNIFFPLLYLCLFVMLYYLFISKLFSNRIAFFSLLLGIPGLHYVQLHTSPHTVAVLITVTAMVLLLKRGTAGIIALAVAIVAVVISHPISPLILLVFLGSYLVVDLLEERGKYQAVLAVVAVFCFLGWLLVRLFHIIPIPDNIISIWTAADTGAELIKSLTPGDFPRTAKYLFGTAFVYSPIHTLNKSIYFLYAAVAAAVTVWALTANLLRLKSIKTWVMRLGGLGRSQWFLLIAAPLLLILTVLLGEYERGEYGLTERSLTFIILTLSSIIASVLLKPLSSRVLERAKIWFCVVLVVILTLSFPIISYSKDAYTSIPESELSAVGFVESHKLVAVKPVDGHEFIVPGFQPAGWNWDTNLPLQYNSVMFRSTRYYYHAMRTDLSFSDNKFIRARETIVNGNEYNKIYNSPTTEIFLEKVQAIK